MIVEITLIVLIISNILLWIGHTKMKMVIGSFIKQEMEAVKRIRETLEGDDKK